MKRDQHTIKKTKTKRLRSESLSLESELSSESVTEKCGESSKEMYIYEKRRICMKRVVYIDNREKCERCVKRDVYISKET